MRILDSKAFDRARRFMLARGRPLDRALFLFRFEAGPAEDVRRALSAYRNDDGGFGDGLEPDFQLPASSPMATSHAFHALREIGAGDDDALVAGAIRYLLEQVDPSREGWRDVPPEVNDFPHAPWWNRDASGTADPNFEWGNPDADIVAALHEHAALVPPDLLDDMTRTALERLASTPAPCPRYLAVCYLRLADAAPAAVRATIVSRLRADARSILDLDATALDAGEMQSWWLAGSPDSPLADLLQPELDANLDREIARQHADGYWEPRWTWGGAYPEGWARARSELLGSESLRTLLALRAWGRIEGA
ncbi:MAG: hypothetical protein JRG76_07075 [Deltaproteobacteria bacterium]|nr:hypothetical protein [Deltaproteobacteria bacterium]